MVAEGAPTSGIGYRLFHVATALVVVAAAVIAAAAIGAGVRERTRRGR